MPEKTFERTEMRLSNCFWQVDVNNNPYDCDNCLEQEMICETHHELEWLNNIDEIKELADCLNRAGWNYIKATGYGTWRNTYYESKVLELNGDNLKSLLFCYNTDMTVKIEDFNDVFNGTFKAKLLHHDRPMGETMTISKVDSQELVND